MPSPKGLNTVTFPLSDEAWARPARTSARVQRMNDRVPDACSARWTEVSRAADVVGVVDDIVAGQDHFRREVPQGDVQDLRSLWADLQGVDVRPGCRRRERDEGRALKDRLKARRDSHFAASKSSFQALGEAGGPLCVEVENGEARKSREDGGQEAGDLEVDDPRPDQTDRIRRVS